MNLLRTNCRSDRARHLSGLITALLLAGIALFPGCGISSSSVLNPNGSDTPEVIGFLGVRPAQSPQETVILRIHGSNTIGAQLGPALAEAFLRKRGASEVRIVPRGPDEVSVQGVFLGDSAPKSIEIAAHGSATAFTDLRDEKCDIGAASRPIKDEEVASLDLVRLGHTEHVLGLDGIAVIVHASSSIRFLAREQIRGIFDGHFTNWSQVYRTKSGPIHVYARDEKSGTWDTFKNLVLGDSPLVSTAKRIEDSRDLSDQVANDSDGIGFIGLPYILNAKAVAVSNPGSEPLLPTPLTVATEDYALSRRLFLYIPENPRNKVTRDFVAFALSREGQDIVTRMGFVGQTTDPVMPPPPPVNAPAEYIKLIDGAARLPLDFRFRSGKSDLDSKALEDMRRMVEFVASPQNAGRKIMLLGFADSIGSPQANLKLSQDRAGVVAEELKIRGIKAFTVTGFGSKLPVDTNETESGRAKNRRVEVWLRK